MKDFITKLYCYDEEPVITTEDFEDEEIDLDLDIEVGRKSKKRMVIQHTSSEEDDEEVVGPTENSNEKVDLDIDAGESMIVVTIDDM